MIIFYAFFNLVIGLIPICCFDAWTEWESSSTCGKVCRLRKRNLLTGWEAVGAEDCNYDHDPCPWYLTEKDSCRIIDCREYDFKIKLFVRYL